jgi:hypothetical protein
MPKIHPIVKPSITFNNILVFFYCEMILGPLINTYSGALPVALCPQLHISTYSQLPSYLQPEDMPCCGDKGPTIRRLPVRWIPEAKVGHFFITTKFRKALWLTQPSCKGFHRVGIISTKLTTHSPLFTAKV